jgi:EAL domain-containing protein (putative c-di-GMP-specific phosphodiesterase class I)
VKIDGSFVRDIIELARGHGLETVAEYVETEAVAAAQAGRRLRARLRLRQT